MKKQPKRQLAGKRGPKADPGRTRAEILAAARAEFGRSGFEGATLRSIAASAEVDVALISYYFGSKAELFVAALELPVNPATALGAIFESGLDDAGARMLTTLLAVWEEPATRAPLVALLRSLTTQSELLREYFEQQLVSTVAAAIDGPDRELRATAFVSQVLGLVLERYILCVEPLASASHEEIVALIGPTLQRYLTG